MTFLALFLILAGPFLVVGAIAAVAQAAGGPGFFTLRRPQFAPAMRSAVAW